MLKYPVPFSNYGPDFGIDVGTITGTIDGINPTFHLSAPCVRVIVYLNGVALTPAANYIHKAGTDEITFREPFIPRPGADLYLEGWICKD